MTWLYPVTVERDVAAPCLCCGGCCLQLLVEFLGGGGGVSADVGVRETATLSPSASGPLHAPRSHGTSGRAYNVGMGLLSIVRHGDGSGSGSGGAAAASVLSPTSYGPDVALSHSRSLSNSASSPAMTPTSDGPASGVGSSAARVAEMQSRLCSDLPIWELVLYEITRQASVCCMCECVCACLVWRECGRVASVDLPLCMASLTLLTLMLTLVLALLSLLLTLLLTLLMLMVLLSRPLLSPQVFVSCEERGVLLERVRLRYLDFRRHLEASLRAVQDHCTSLEATCVAAQVCTRVP